MTLRKRSFVCAIVGAVTIGLAVPTVEVASAAVVPAPVESAGHQMGSWAKSTGVGTRVINGVSQNWAEQGVAGHINGVDIYEGDSPNLAQLHANGAAFAFVKASEYWMGAEHYRQTSFVNQRNAAIDAGLIVGTYQYVHPTGTGPSAVADAANQARDLVSLAGAPQPNQLPLVLDLEQAPSGMSKWTLTKWAITWLATAKALTGRTPILYSYTYFLSSRMYPDPALVSYPLWQADYNRSAPGTISGWPASNRVLWQFSSSGSKVPGANGNLDLDTFVGTSDQWSQLVGFAGGSTRSLKAAQATLARIGNALRAMSSAQNRSYRRMSVPSRKRLRARGAIAADASYTWEVGIGQGSSHFVYLRTAFAGGVSCVRARARAAGAKWWARACPNRRWHAL